MFFAFKQFNRGSYDIAVLNSFSVNNTCYFNALQINPLITLKQLTEVHHGGRFRSISYYITAENSNNYNTDDQKGQQIR